MEFHKLHAVLLITSYTLFCPVSAQSILIANETVKGNLTGNKVSWCVDLKGVYVIEKVKLSNQEEYVYNRLRILVEGTGIKQPEECNVNITLQKEIDITCKNTIMPGGFIVIIEERNDQPTKQTTLNIQVYTKILGRDVAYSKPAAQSHDYGDSYIAKNAVDRNMDSCCFTAQEENKRSSPGWWQIDLLENMSVEAVMIINIRKDVFGPYDYMDNFSVIVSPDNDTYYDSRKICFDYNITNKAGPDGPLLIICENGPKTGRYVLVVKRGVERVDCLNICEIYVFANEASRPTTTNRATVPVTTGSNLPPNGSNGAFLNDASTISQDKIRNIILGVVLGLGIPLVIAFIIVGLLYLKKKKNVEHFFEKVDFKRNKLVSEDEIYIERDTSKWSRCVNIEELPDYFKHHADISDEFKNLPDERVSSFEISSSDVHRLKNRYKDIVPFDDNMVPLNVYENDDVDATYINASFISGHTVGSHSYIACQGPKINTINDTWRMIWQYEIKIIFMVTSFVENSKNKCEPYWPDTMNEEKTYGKIKVDFTVENSYADYAYKEFVIQNLRFPSEEPRTIKHIHFLSWSDKSRPDHCFPLLALRNRIKKMHESLGGIILIHCSAGVGRTGTYIAIDKLLNEAEESEQISVYKCVKELRFQRMNMVQTQEQYSFVYEAVIEATQTGRTVISCEDLKNSSPNLTLADECDSQDNPIDCIISSESDNMCSRNVVLSQISKQYKFLDSIRNKIQPKSSEGINKENISKNHKTETATHNNWRSHLVSPGVGYINAVTVQGYRKNDAYFLTQIPLEHTVNDFWHLIWHKNLRYIFLANNNGERYWPVGSKKTYGSIVVEPLSENKDILYTLRSFVIRNLEDDDPNKTIEVIQLNVNTLVWDSESEVPNSKSKLIEIFKLLANRPCQIMIQCLDGSSRSGLVAAALYVIDMMRVERMIDPYLACRYVLLSRPQAISSLAQYQFLYELAREYIDELDYDLPTTELNRQIYDNL